MLHDDGDNQRTQFPIRSNVTLGLYVSSQGGDRNTYKRFINIFNITNEWFTAATDNSWNVKMHWVALCK